MPLNPATGPARVLVADGHAVWRRGLVSLLAAETGLRVVAEAHDVESALACLRLQPTDVAVIGAGLPGGGAAGVARATRADRHSVRVLAVVPAPPRPEHAAERLATAGVAGAVSKSHSGALIVEAVHAVARGEARWLGGDAVPRSAAPLSERESEVMRTLAEGASNAEIADELYMSESTVRTHLRTIYAKLGLRSARQAVAWAWRSGFVWWRRAVKRREGPDDKAPPPEKRSRRRR